MVVGCEGQLWRVLGVVLVEMDPRRCGFAWGGRCGVAVLFEAVLVTRGGGRLPLVDGGER